MSVFAIRWCRIRLLRMACEAGPDPAVADSGDRLLVAAVGCPRRGLSMGSARYSDRATAADRYPPITAHPGDVALSSQRRRPNPVGHNQIVEVRESQGVHDRSVALVYRLILYVRRRDISWKERRIGRAVTEYTVPAPASQSRSPAVIYAWRAAQVRSEEHHCLAVIDGVRRSQKSIHHISTCTGYVMNTDASSGNGRCRSAYNASRSGMDAVVKVPPTVLAATKSGFPSH